MRRADDVRGTVDAILAEQRRAWVRGVVYAGGIERPVPAPHPIRRIGVLLLTTLVGAGVGLAGNDPATGVALGVAAGLLLGELAM